MLITTDNEIVSLMPTARWSKPEELFGYLEEEERVALEPLLGTRLYSWLLTEYERLREAYTDITATTIRPNGKAKQDARLAHADVTDRIQMIRDGRYRETFVGTSDGDCDVPSEDMASVRLIRICQRIEFYRMFSHKAGLLSVSFNGGGGMNVVTADGYDSANEKDKERAVKDAYMSAGRAVDDLLLFLEADAKGDRLFTDRWQEADAFYLHKDLLFQTARVLNEYLPIKGERMAYVELVRDIRFCQNTYLRPRIGWKLLNAVVEFANAGGKTAGHSGGDDGVWDELLSLLRTALAFYVESRRTTVTSISLLSGATFRSTTSSYQKEDRLSRRDSMTDAQQAMSMACSFIEENLDALGDAAADTPIYNIVREREEQERRERACACAAAARRNREACELARKKLFTGFPATHRMPELK